jgi:uncharacterized membrane protein
MFKLASIIGKWGCLAIALIILASSFFSTHVSADEIDYSEQFFQGEFIQILGSGEREVFGTEQNYQILEVQFLKGKQQGEVIELNYINPIIKGSPQELKEGQPVVLVKSELDDEVTYEIYEPYRLPSLFWLAALFVLLAILIAGWRGASSLIGLAATLFILIKWIIPGIVAGGSPLLISFIGAVAIAAISIYLSHGFSKRTTVAVVSTLLTLCLSLFMAILAVSFSSLFGMGSEDTIYLSSFGDLDLRGLLLGAIVIGTLGVLDDITTTQAAATEEIHKANKSFHFKELYKRSFSVGKEHIASMINTLVIAYVGASFPIFLLITKSPQPLWVILNNEFLAEEIVRTLVGSATLVLAVPISTALAAYAYSKKKIS